MKKQAKGPKFRAGDRVLLECVVYRTYDQFIVVDTSDDSKYLVTVCVDRKQLRPVREAGPARGRKRT